MFNDEQPFNYEKRISAIAEDFSTKEGTRTTYEDTGSRYAFAWTEGDVLGVFPQNGFQTAFPISNGYGTNTAVFDGGDWSLKANASYAAYYPFKQSLDFVKTAIPVDYTGQVQNGNGSTAHLGKYDFMASTFEEVDDKGNVNFQLQHLGCLVRFKLTMPEADTYSSLEITSNKAPFITAGYYSLSDNSHALFDIEQSNTITIGLNKVSTTEDNKDLTIAAMFAPTDLTGSWLTLTVKGEKENHSFEIEGKDLTQGRASALQEIPYVTFHAAVTQTLKMSNAVETLEYSVNNGAWTTLGTTTVTFGGSNGDLKLRGKSATGTSFSSESVGSQIIFGYNTKPVNCSGDIRTLVDYDNYQTADCSNARFAGLFKDCAALISAPKLPAKSLASYAYCNMFWNCTSLVTAPDLPAMNLAYECYSCMFCNCTSLTEVPERLPATTLASYCYENMFEGCTKLTSVPELPATTLAAGCYARMFLNCKSLVNAPALPATELSTKCYMTMFSGCTSLQTAPKLSATKLATCCYQYMFSGCTSLASAPELPATSLADHCYNEMFYGCTSLQTAPELPATKLAPDCYNSMFNNCSSLTTAPDLLAKNLVDNCYANMFYGCRSLTQIKMMAEDISATNCLSYWMFNVKSSGTFVKNSKATWNERGSSGIPYGWTIIEENPYIIDGHEYVDLGLPSGLKWATCNIGASDAEKFGDYFAWGETEPKASYSFANYKYNITAKYDAFNRTLSLEDDAAAVKWGGSWRMPTRTEQQELWNGDYCSWEKTTINGVSGYLVTSKIPGYTNKSIFLPAAGYYYNSNWETTYNVYWSSTVVSDNKDYAYSIYWGSSYNLEFERFHGASIRAVHP